MHKPNRFIKTKDYLSPETRLKTVEMEHLLCSSKSNQSTTDNFFIDDEEEIDFIF